MPKSTFFTDQAKMVWWNYAAILKNPAADPEHTFCELVRMALKFQDRVSRHACIQRIESAASKEFPELIKVSDAISACSVYDSED